AVFVLAGHRILLFALELIFALSILIGIRLVRALFVPLDLVRTGAELISERNFTTRFVPVGQQEVDTLVGVYNTMLDRLREERLAAEEKHQLLEKIVRASPAGIVICDFDTRIEQMNPAATALVTDDVRAVMTALADGESRLIAHGGPRRLRISRTEFRDRGFEKSFFLIEELTEELRLSEKSAYEKLIRMMSHEVNNSVGAVRSLLESLLRYARDVREEDRDDFVSALTIASSRMDALNRFMRGFGDVVRIPQPHRTSVDVASLISDVAALLKPELDSRRIALHLDLGTIMTVSADRSQLEQVAINVLRNAIESIGEDGAIDITLRDDSLSIADNGPGIADEIRADLFTPFFTTKRDGRGLGLTIVQEILANHGFAYALRNREGGGAEFRVGF
ncbi:MAG TPA: ATP-binding protein, partial [Thermoanaerobaculia bacterium]|nr:ATP-binding protein [Thermoanaerobaculia bacterium]